MVSHLLGLLLLAPGYQGQQIAECTLSSGMINDVVPVN